MTPAAELEPINSIFCSIVKNKARESAAWLKQQAGLRLVPAHPWPANDTPLGLHKPLNL